MPTTTQVNDLKINRLTKAQYDAAVRAGTIGEYELSILTDVDESIQKAELPTATAENEGKIYQYVGTTNSSYTNGHFYKCIGEGSPAVYSWVEIEVQNTPDLEYVPQLDTLPTADATNLGEIVQYSGTTIPDVDATATGTQTAGSGLTDITVNVATFEGVEQPTGAETVEFTASVTPDTASLGEKVGTFDCLFNPEEYLAALVRTWGSQWWDVCPLNAYFVLDTPNWWVLSRTPDTSDILAQGVNNGWGGFTVVDESQAVSGNYVPVSVILGSKSWSKDSEPVDITAYGVSFSGTPADGDEITVTYTPAEQGITNGYFYESTASYSDPSATISQTTGSGLTGLAVNVDTFIATEQPTQSESVAFTATLSGGPSIEISPNSEYVDSVTLDSAVFVQDFVNAGEYTILQNFQSGRLESYDGGTTIFAIVFDANNSAQVDVTNACTVSGLREITIATIVSVSLTSVGWEKSGNTVNIADYGVSYEGTPTTGDVLTVVYTAPTATGYSWKQKNVQPAPEVPDVGIDWKTSVDLPGNFQEGSWGVTPIFKISGGLPDGIYEFYYQIKTGGTFTSAADFIPAIATFRYLIKVDNLSSSIKGMFAPVIDGECIGNNTKRAPQEEESIWSLGWKDENGNFYFWSDSNWWNTDLHGYTNPCPDVSDCFRLSAIKNLTTGQEYIAEGSLYDNVQPPYQMGSQIVIKAIQVTQYVPSSTVYGDINISMLGASQTLVCQGIRYESGKWVYSSELTVNMKCGDDRFSARFQAFVDEYVLTIDEATGIFENTEFVKTLSSLYVKLNLPAGTTSGIIQSQYAMKDMTMSMGAGFYNEDITGQLTTQLIPLKAGVAPSVANYLGKIVQYKGATDANYTNGYFYKATGNIVNVPGSVTCTETSELGKTITLDVDGFLNYMMGLGYDQSTIENWLNNSFIFEYSVDSNSLYWNCIGAVPDPTTALQYFTFSPAATSGEYIIWTTSNYVAAHTGVQNAAWEEVKTQPGATTPSTMPTLLVANWSSNTQTVTVQGVTASNNVIVSPAPASAADYASSGIVCTAQSTDSLTFTCTQTPSNDITVNVAIL